MGSYKLSGNTESILFNFFIFSKAKQLLFNKTCLEVLRGKSANIFKREHKFLQSGNKQVR